MAKSRVPSAMCARAALLRVTDVAVDFVDRVFISDSPRQEQAGSLRTGRSDQYPTFFPVKRSVFDQFEA